MKFEAHKNLPGFPKNPDAKDVSDLLSSVTKTIYTVEKGDKDPIPENTYKDKEPKEITIENLNKIN